MQKRFLTPFTQFIARRTRDKFQGNYRIYGWSAYSQGSHENKQNSAEPFIDQALIDFGYSGPVLEGVRAKGEALAKLIQNKRTLLILDGLEPLQHIQVVQAGRLKDDGLETIIRYLSMFNPGLLVLTSRQPFPELPIDEPRVIHRELDVLTIPASIDLLKSTGLVGSENKFKELALSAAYHPFILHLLGNYICYTYGGNLKSYERTNFSQIIEDLVRLENTRGIRAKAMINYYKHLLENINNKDNMQSVCLELMILYIIGLFDRPVHISAIEFVLSDPIQGLTEFYESLGTRQRRQNVQLAFERLRGLKLLNPVSSSDNLEIDTHPLVREHFAEQFKTDHPNAFIEVHQRLYKYYASLPEKHQPETLIDMEPLFLAVRHGCAAELHQQVFDEIYQERILRNEEYYTLYKLGSFGADLACQANFFEFTAYHDADVENTQAAWSTPVANLNEETKAELLSLAGFSLRALGRLEDAIGPYHHSMNLRFAQKNWEEAAKAAGNVSELHLVLGQLKKARQAAEKALEYSKKSRPFRQVVAKALLADIMHQLGDFDSAKKMFEAAESQQAAYNKESPYLYSQRGNRYCDLLLSHCEPEQVLQRAEAALELAKKKGNLLGCARDTLDIGRAEATISSLVPNLTSARSYMDNAILKLRQAGQEDELARGLLVRADFLVEYIDTFNADDLRIAHEDLLETIEITNRGPMRLYLADAHLICARLYLHQKSDGLLLNLSCQESRCKKLKDHLVAAEKLINETGYHRRDAEVYRLKEKAKLACSSQVKKY